MRRTHAELWVHLVWATWDREPLILPDVESALYRSMARSAEAVGAEAVAIGGTANHVHLLTRVPPVASVAALVHRLKGASSHLVTQEFDTPFRWQGGYGAFSVSRWDVARVTGYVRRQKEHHAAGTLSRILEATSDEVEPAQAGFV